MAISENRKEELDALQRQLFFEDTQLASEVLRRGIRRFREERELSEEKLGQAMTEAGVPLTGDKISKIEKGRRRVTIDELLAFAHVLGVPLSRLMSPPLGDRPIRAGGEGLECHEVGNWMVWGDSTGRANFTGRTRMRLAREIATMAQVFADEADDQRRTQHVRSLMRAVERLRKNMNIPPGVMKRQELRDKMESAQSVDENPTAIE